MKKTLGAVAAAAAIAISLSACGGSAPASTEAKGEINYWLWDANQLPAYQQCADDFHQGQPGHQGQDHPARLGRLLDHADQRLRRRHRPRRLHQPPLEVPRVRREEAAALPRRRSGQGRHQAGELHQGTRRALGGPGRQALRTAQGLGHRGPLLQQGHDGLRRPDRRADGQPGLEPAGRRQLREGNRAPDRGQERRARRRGRFRQEQRGRLRPRPRRQRLRAGPDRVELPQRHHRLERHGQEPLGHQVQLRRPQVPGDHRLVGRTDREGLHAQARNHRRRQPGGQLRRRQGCHQHHG